MRKIIIFTLAILLMGAPAMGAADLLYVCTKYNRFVTKNHRPYIVFAGACGFVYEVKASSMYVVWDTGFLRERGPVNAEFMIPEDNVPFTHVEFGGMAFQD